MRLHDSSWVCFLYYAKNPLDELLFVTIDGDDDSRNDADKSVDDNDDDDDDYGDSGDDDDNDYDDDSNDD